MFRAYKLQNYRLCIYRAMILFGARIRIVFFIRILAELNRRPIDLVEGESELVSGFNVEYFRGLFGLISQICNVDACY